MQNLIHIAALLSKLSAKTSAELFNTSKSLASKSSELSDDEKLRLYETLSNDLHSPLTKVRK